MNLFDKKYIKHLVAILILAIIAVIYFYPETQGKKILSHDQVSAAASSQEHRDYQNKGETTLWTSRIFSGMPLFMVAYRVKANLLNQFYLIFDIFPKSMGLWFSLLLGFYICLSLLGYRTEISLIGALAFGLSTWLMLSIEAGHSSKILVISTVPPLLASIVITYRGKWLLGGILTSLFLALAIMLGHPQIVYFSMFFIFIIIVGHLVGAIQHKTVPTFFKRSTLLLGFAILGILPNTARLWSTYEYTKETTRGGKSELTKDIKQSTGLDLEYAMTYSYGKAESINILIPGFAGSGANLNEKSETFLALKEKGATKKQALDYVKGIPLYYGEPPINSGPSYMGAAIIFLFLLMLFIYKNKFKWVLLSTVILSLMLAWGRHFLLVNEFMFDHFPFFDKFRTPSMWISMGMIAIVWGAMIALREIFEEKLEPQKIKKSLFYTGGILAGWVLFVYVFKSSITDFAGPYDAELEKNGIDINILIEDRISMVSSDILRTLIIIGLSFALVWMIVFKKIKNTALAYFIVALLIIGDLWLVDKRFLNSDDFTKAKSFEKSIVASAADLQILKDKEPNYRVFNTTVSSFNDNFCSYFHQSVGGYSAVKLIRYQDLIERQLAKGSMPVFNMLNTKYFITGNPGQEIAQQNPGALGSAWFVNEISWAKNADDEMAQLTNFNPSKTALVDERFKNYFTNFDITQDSLGTISLTSFHPDKMIYSSNSDENKLAVFSEIWYKGNVDWTASIDGAETEFIRVNYLLRGLKIPKGKHEIIFKFYPKSHYTGSTISLIFSILIILLIIGVGVAKLMGFSLPGLKEDADSKLTN